MVAFYYVSGGDKPAHVLPNYWFYTNIWGFFYPLQFFIVDNVDLLYLDLKRGDGQEEGK